MIDVLPQPEMFAQQHSQELTQLIVTDIAQQGGKITFARYMELALYAPGYGYYTAGAAKLGAAGDFVTAPEISPLFSRCISQQMIDVLQQFTAASILELGAGSGVMAADILLSMQAFNRLPAHYFILEISADLRERQQQTLQQRCPELLSRVQWLDSLPQQFEGVIVANEVLDALPVHRFCVNNNMLQEIYVTQQNHELAYCLAEPSDAVLQVELEQIHSNYLAELPYYESEFSLAVPGLVRSLSQCLQAGLILLLDYGFPRAEFYHPHRNQGTLMCHYRHRAHADPFFWPGLQDLTAHVDFTQIAETAVAADLQVAGYTTQGAFLLGCGLAEMILENDNTAAKYSQAQQIKLLTMPHEMGELFKVIALTRNLKSSLTGFAWQDQRGRL